MLRASIAVLALALMADGPAYTAGLQQGAYTLQSSGGTVEPSVCVGDLRPLLQAAHGPDDCRFFTVYQRTNATRVSYECADGSGLVSLKAITPRSATLQATGVRGARPYSIRIGARRSGDCG